MTVRATLYIRTLSYWICSTGATRGRLFDAVCVRDDDACPYIPGRHLRGLLRDAVLRLPETGPNRARVLFGPRNEDGLGYGSALRVSSARMPPQLKASLPSPGASREAALFTTIQSTAIDDETGSARSKSLRSYEVAAPTVLVATIEANRAAFGAAGELLDPGDWIATLSKALPLVRSVGAHRTRGFGRALLELAPEAAEASA